MNACDKNRDGCINKDEFEKYFKLVSNQAFAFHKARAQKKIVEDLKRAEEEAEAAKVAEAEAAKKAEEEAEAAKNAPKVDEPVKEV